MCLKCRYVSGADYGQMLQIGTTYTADGGSSWA